MVAIVSLIRSRTRRCRSLSVWGVALACGWAGLFIYLNWWFTPLGSLGLGP